ncbi:dynein regulatory complex subunit 2 [Indicator indicator]|uniref:dynein regulatory complex subunit 2 n=1 Tax=Indicator indicator TaxID=1002788 RepID=UPI0023DF96EF|nr:dynein regulatory complex subunit 2 [Indicator indicator]
MLPKKHPEAAAPMSAEDGLLLLEKQVLAEEQAAKTKAELLSRFLKDKLAKEKHSSALNLHKLNAQWRVVLREAKDRELHQDIQILSQTFAQVMDGKDNVIESLATDLEEAEEQQAQALHSHLHNIDCLLQLQRCRLRCLEDGYEAQLEVLKLEFEAERKTILEQHERESCSLQDMVLATEQNYIKNYHEAEQNFQSVQAELKNKNLLEKQYSHAQVTNKLEVLWEKFQRAAQSYAEASEHPKIALKALKQKDKKTSMDITMQTKKLKKLQDLVIATKGQLAAQRLESEEQTKQGQEEKERVFGKLLELQSKMNQARTKVHGDLARLILQSNTALKTLRKVVEKAQHVLRLAEMCHRLETEEEKVLPFYSSPLAEGEQQDAQRVLKETPTEPLAQALQDYVGLELLWQCFNKAKLEEQALGQEQEALRKRNRWLRELLGQYLGGISGNQEVPGEPNPLLTIQHIPRDLPHAGGDSAQDHQSDAHPSSLLRGDKSLDCTHSSPGIS